MIHRQLARDLAANSSYCDQSAPSLLAVLDLHFLPMPDQFVLSGVMG